MPNKTQKLITSIKNILLDKPSSISEIAEKLEINWRTAENYLEILKNLDLVEEKNIKNTRTFFFKDKDNYFGLPIKNEHSKLISSIYTKIKESCLKLFEKEPTKTQAYKIIWNVNKNLSLGLPVGWYKYGPCCVQVYKGEEKAETPLSPNIIKVINETTKDYCILDNITLQKKVYTDAKNKLYQTKEDLLQFNSNSKEDLNLILMDMVKYAPEETIETTTDFCRATLLLGWDKTETLFGEFWKYLTMVVFKHSLTAYYGKELETYIDKKIEDTKKEVQLNITSLVRAYLKSK